MSAALLNLNELIFLSEDNISDRLKDKDEAMGKERASEKVVWLGN